MELAQVVVTEGNHRSPISYGIKLATGSWWTHNFIVVGDNLAVEATFPRVRLFRIDERLAELERENREHVILELPGLSDDQKVAVAEKAKSFVGRWYDVGQLIVYALFGKFIDDGPGTLVCSRLVTAAYYDNDHNLFPKELLLEKYGMCFPRFDNLLDGYATPSDLLKSKLRRVR